MRVLIIKTSSIGDVVNTLPAMTDATQMIPGIRFDWLVEDSLKEIPRWHYATERVIPVRTQDLSKNLWRNLLSGQWWRMKNQIRANDYFAVLDSEGVWMNSWLSRYANGPCFGLDKESARDRMASRYNNHDIAIPKGLHAVERSRQFFAKALGYDFPRAVANTGVKLAEKPSPEALKLTQGGSDYLVFLCGAGWDTKLWPVSYWQTIAKQAGKKGYRVLIPWRYQNEKAIAEEVATVGNHVQVFPRKSLTELAYVLQQSKGVVAVDTGLTHIAAAFNVPCVSLYGPTDPGLSGAYGQNQVHLFANYSCSPCLKPTCTYDGPKVKNQLGFGQGEYVNPPCFSSLMPGYVFDVLQQQIEVKFGASVKLVAS